MLAIAVRACRCCHEALAGAAAGSGRAAPAPAAAPPTPSPQRHLQLGLGDRLVGPPLVPLPRLDSSGAKGGVAQLVIFRLAADRPHHAAAGPICGSRGRDLRPLGPQPR